MIMQNHLGEKDWFYCTKCDFTFLFRGNETPGCKEPDEEVRCPDCFIVLGHLRADGSPPALIKRWKGKHHCRHD